MTLWIFYFKGVTSIVHSAYYLLILFSMKYYHYFICQGKKKKTLKVPYSLVFTIFFDDVSEINIFLIICNLNQGSSDLKLAYIPIYLDCLPYCLKLQENDGPQV